MTELHYLNLGVKKPTLLLENAYYGLRPIYNYLKRVKTHLESDEAVKRLSWSLSEPLDGSKPEAGCWVLLEEPEGEPTVPESVFRAFMDENLREVYQSAGDAKQEPEEKIAYGRNQNPFDKRYQINILDRDPENYRLLLAERPTSIHLLLRPNTLTIHRQIQAIQSLQDQPNRKDIPLLKLMEPKDYATWERLIPTIIPDADWKVLTDTKRPGTSEQRDFVQRALGTPDFAILEGPPGSGKTTTICELILQLIERGKRVLLCASTHVAVDNVLERLMAEKNLHRDSVIPVRIGEKQAVSEKVLPWTLHEFIKTERKRILTNLAKATKPSDSQLEMKRLLSQGASAIERMILDAANLICGTTIGILQHPDLKASKQGSEAPESIKAQSLEFDFMIIDEASKTTFQEFLVPALHAERWIIVGDVKQLSPYVDDEWTAKNIEACLPEDYRRNACIDIFMACPERRGNRRPAVVTTSSPEEVDAYRNQARGKKLNLKEAPIDDELWSADIVIGEHKNLERLRDTLPIDTSTVRSPEGTLETTKRRAKAWNRRAHPSSLDQPEWATELAWRLTRHHELREETGHQKAPEHTKRTPAERLREDIKDLLPLNSSGSIDEPILERIYDVQRISLPSVMELLQKGFERGKAKRDTALTDGLPEWALQERHILLSTQHRMHAEIAEFSRHNIYKGKALVTPDYLNQSRDWSYPRYSNRAVWIDVNEENPQGKNSNQSEARQLMKELQKFEHWARENPKKDGSPWEVAVLALYRGQERLLRERIRIWTNQKNGISHFSRLNHGNRHLSVHLCTVDRFQGHEADIVFISIANSRPTSFLESPNRWNVALTRARYQRVIIGNRHAMLKRSNGLLGNLAKHEKWEKPI